MHDAGVLMGKKREILSHFVGRLPLFTRLQQNRANICNGYKVGVREFTYHRHIMLHYDGLYYNYDIKLVH